MTETRAEKAQRLVDEGWVSITQRHPLYTEARVKGKSGLYTTILRKSGHFFCTCAWGQIHSHADDLCAHALAVRMVVERTSS